MVIAYHFIKFYITEERALKNLLHYEIQLEGTFNVSPDLDSGWLTEYSITTTEKTSYMMTEVNAMMIVMCGADIANTISHTQGITDAGYGVSYICHSLTVIHI